MEIVKGALRDPGSGLVLSTRAQLAEFLERSNPGGFESFKLEKDFYLTAFLGHVARDLPDLVFKGGTCLNKVYFDYFRLSEDLDFVLRLDANRAGRQKALSDCKETLVAIAARLGLSFDASRRTSHDEHRQGLFSFGYASVFDRSAQTIRVDVTVRPALRLEPVAREVKSVFRDLVFGVPFFAPCKIACMDLREAMAEKLRAAMTRPEPAIRDFYDLAYVRRHAPDFDFEAIRPLVRAKLEESRFAYTYRDKLEFLRSRIRPELAPVVRDADSFDLDAAFRFVAGFEA